MKFRTVPTQSLRIPVMVEERLARIPKDAMIKGMFMDDPVRALGPDLDALLPTLTQPPRFGRFLPFSNYPQVDGVRLMFAASRKMFPGESTAQGARLLSRNDFKVFGDSKLGSVIMSFVGNAEAAYMRFPDLIKMSTTGVEATAKKLGEHAVQIELKGMFGILDNGIVGTIEGIGLHYDVAPTIETHIPTDGHAVYDVTW